jgi:hypothetical protein
MRRTGLTGGEILCAHGFQDSGKCRYGLPLGLVCFRFMVPPLQPEVVGPYPVRGAWLPSHLLLEGTDRI